MSELTTFASRLTLPNGVMVAHQILVLFVWVRVLFGQPKFQTPVWNFFCILRSVAVLLLPPLPQPQPQLVFAGVVARFVESGSAQLWRQEILLHKVALEVVRIFVVLAV